MEPELLILPPRHLQQLGCPQDQLQFEDRHNSEGKDGHEAHCALNDNSFQGHGASTSAAH